MDKWKNRERPCSVADFIQISPWRGLGEVLQQKTRAALKRGRIVQLSFLNFYEFEHLRNLSSDLRTTVPLAVD